MSMLPATVREGGGRRRRGRPVGGADESEAASSAKTWVQAGVDDASVGAAERRSATATEGGRAATEGGGWRRIEFLR
jgi:hypothetical protein